MSQVLIIYHSRTGNNEAMARAVSDGAVSAGATVVMKKVTEATGSDIVNCDAVAFGSPIYYGYMAGVLKDFFDSNTNALREEIDNKPYATFSSSGSGKSLTLESIDNVCEVVNRVSKATRLSKVCDGIATPGKPSPEVLEECKELGVKLATA